MPFRLQSLGVCGMFFLVISAMPYAFAQINTYPYFEDFESGPGGWASSGTDNSWTFGTPAKAIINGAASGSNVWVNGGLTATYPNGETSQVLSPIFDFSSLSAPRIGLEIWWQTESGFDGAVLQSSVDNGTSWQNVGAFGDPNNWYSDNTVDANPGGQADGWTGASGGYVSACHVLDGLGGQPNVLLRMAFASDVIVPDDGVAFDDILIQESAAPEIDIQRPALTSIASNGSDPQGNQPVNSPVSLIYTVLNQMFCSSLTVSSVTVQNQNNVSATITQTPASPVAGPGTTSLAIEYTVAAADAFSFDLIIASSDADENPYTITVSGTGLSSEIDVQRPAGSSITSGGTDAQGGQTVGAAVALNYTVANQGNTDLTVSGVTLQNQNNVSATLTQAPGSPVAGPGTTTLAIEYTVTVIGAFSFDLVITNSDADENPYTITVSGTGIAAPVSEIDVQRPVGTSIASGSTDIQGNQTVGAAVTLSYTLTNQGNTDLAVSGVTVQNQNNVSATLTQTPGSPVAGLTSTLFTIEYTVTTAGVFSFDVVIANDDADENPYTITVSGTGTTTPVSEIDVQRPAGTAIMSGGTDAQGDQTVGAAVALSYTVANQGNADLAVSGVTPQNQNNVSATLTQAPGSPVAGLTSTTFVIGYTVAVAGAFSFTIFIANDDADENPYTITVSGTGIATPASEIDVQRPAGTSITSGGTDTQGDQTVGTAVALSYTVANQGNADLAVNGVTLQNQNNVRTAVNQTPDTSVTGSNSTLFSIEYTVIAAGAFSFDVVIANDDADENPYTITVSGTGIAVPAGEIDVQNPAGASIVSGGTDAQGNQAAGAVVTLSYTLANQGNADLVVDGVTIQNQNNVSAMITQTPASPVAGAGATTFIIEYTVAAAGAFSFDFVIANDDANENSYTITVSGTGSTVIISTLSTWALVVLSLLLGSFGALSRRAAGARL